MTEDNEVQIILTAVDNASSTIDKVNDSLGGVGSSGGFVKSAEEATQSAKELTDSFEGMNLEQLSYISTLGMSKEQQIKYNAALDAAAAKTKAATTATKGLSGSMIALSAAVVVVGAAAEAYIVLKNAAEWANKVLEDTSIHSERVVQEATEFKEVMDDFNRVMDTGNQIWENLKSNVGLWTAVVVTDVVDATKALIGLLGFEGKKGAWATGGLTKEFTKGFEDATNAVKGTADAVDSLAKATSQMMNAGIGLVFSYQSTFEKLADKQKELADALAGGFSETSDKVLGLKDDIASLEGELDKTTNKFVLDMYKMQLAADGVFDKEDMVKYLDMALALGLIGQEAYDAAVKTLGLGGAIAALQSRDIRINVSHHTHYSSSGSRGSGIPDAGDGDVGIEDWVQVPTIPKVTIPEKKYGGKLAGGGTVGMGGWAMVGDSLGGGITPYTEYVHANKGGGFTVYNQSQMSGKSAPPMASGGMVLPQSEEIELSDRTIDKLADALAYKVTMRQ